MPKAQSLLPIRSSVVLCLLLSLTACVPLSQHPVKPHDATTMDSRLYGVWYWADDDEYGYVHIGTDWETGLLRLVMLDHRADGRLSRDEYQGHSSISAEHRYLNLQEVTDDGVDEDYLIIKYVIDGQGLGIAMMDSEVLREDIEKRRLAGMVERNSERITASGLALQAYLAAKDKTLFPKTAYLSRLPWPAPTVPVETPVVKD